MADDPQNMGNEHETNGRSKVNWPTFFAGCGLVLTIGAVVVNAMVSQWTVQFSAVNRQIEHEREVTELKLRINSLDAQLGTVKTEREQQREQKERFEAEITKFKKEPPATITSTQGK